LDLCACCKHFGDITQPALSPLSGTYAIRVFLLRLQMGAELERVTRERDAALARLNQHSDTSAATEEQLAAVRKQLRQTEVRQMKPALFRSPAFDSHCYMPE